VIWRPPEGRGEWLIVVLPLDTPKCFAAEAYARKDPGSGVCLGGVGWVQGGKGGRGGLAC